MNVSKEIVQIDSSQPPLDRLLCTFYALNANEHTLDYCNAEKSVHSYLHIETTKNRTNSFHDKFH